MNEEKITTSANKKLSPEEIKRVKGLGCLQDKRYDDIFNIRVITGNGHITTDEHRAIADAADKFGNGQITMTTRLSMEIQGVPYDNIEKTIAFLGEHGLMTGGTGAKVRPVVSCKGTTCQYGLIDTFALSKKIHERFYVGYHDVVLPHKFKIAVGGCPNNCVKPNLNDMGIIGQRIPKPDVEKCRGCKKCQIEKSCPVHVPKLVDGNFTLILKNVSIADAARENVLSAQYRNIRMVIKSISEAAGVSESHTVRLLPGFSQRKKK